MYNYVCSYSLIHFLGLRGFRCGPMCVSIVHIQSARFSTQVCLLRVCKLLLAMFACLLLVCLKVLFWLVFIVVDMLDVFGLYFPMYLASSLYVLAQFSSTFRLFSHNSTP